jgi:hypothetical protein
MLVLFQTDAFINATAIAKQFGKKPEHYLRTNETKEYISALQKHLFPTENSVTLKMVTEQNQLVIVKQGNFSFCTGSLIFQGLITVKKSIYLYNLLVT